MKGKLIGIFTLCIVILYSCDSEPLEKVPEENFIGTWEIIGRSHLKGLQIEIKKTNQGQLEGRIRKLNDDQLVRMFMDTNEVFIKGINRLSNYQFELVENKLGHALFSIYGIDTDNKIKVVLKGDNFINFSANDDDNKVGYKRIK